MWGRKERHDTGIKVDYSAHVTEKTYRGVSLTQEQIRQLDHLSHTNPNAAKGYLHEIQETFEQKHGKGTIRVEIQERSTFRRTSGDANFNSSRERLELPDGTSATIDRTSLQLGRNGSGFVESTTDPSRTTANLYGVAKESKPSLFGWLGHLIGTALGGSDLSGTLLNNREATLGPREYTAARKAQKMDQVRVYNLSETERQVREQLGNQGFQVEITNPRGEIPSVSDKLGSYYNDPTRVTFQNNNGDRTQIWAPGGVDHSNIVEAHRAGLVDSSTDPIEAGNFMDQVYNTYGIVTTRDGNSYVTDQNGNEINVKDLR